MTMALKFLTCIILFVMLGLVGIHYTALPYTGAQSVEQTLKHRATQALRQADISWATITMDGQKAILTGTARNREEAGRAARIVRQSVWAGGIVAGGVTQVDISRLRYANMSGTMLPVAAPFTWSASLTDTGSLTMEGFVPDERTRLALIAEAENIFSAPIDDKMQLARGKPRGDWLRSARLGLVALSRLEAGRLTLSDHDVTLAGFAPDEDGLTKAGEALETISPPFSATTSLELVDPSATGTKAMESAE